MHNIKIYNHLDVVSHKEVVHNDGYYFSVIIITQTNIWAVSVLPSMWTSIMLSSAVCSDVRGVLIIAAELHVASYVAHCNAVAYLRSVPTPKMAISTDYASRELTAPTLIYNWRASKITVLQIYLRCKHCM